MSVSEYVWTKSTCKSVISFEGTVCKEQGGSLIGNNKWSICQPESVGWGGVQSSEWADINVSYTGLSVSLQTHSSSQMCFNSLFCQKTLQEPQHGGMLASDTYSKQVLSSKSCFKCYKSRHVYIVHWLNDNLNVYIIHYIHCKFMVCCELHFYRQF